MRETSFPKTHKFSKFCSKKFSRVVYVTEQIWCTISTTQQKLCLLIFLQPEIVIGSWLSFQKFCGNFWILTFQMRAKFTWESNSDPQYRRFSKSYVCDFFVARDCIWKLMHFCNRIFLVPKIPRFLTFFEKIFMLRSIILKSKNYRFESFHELSIEHTFGVLWAARKNFTRKKVFLHKNFWHGGWGKNVKKQRVFQ